MNQAANTPGRVEEPAHTGAAPSCKLCGGETAPFIERNRFGIVRCRGCGFMFALIPDGLELNALYADDAFWTGAKPKYRYAGGYDRHWNHLRPFYEARIPRIRSLAGPGRMLEIGCADGRFLAAARKLGFEVAGVELSPLMRERCAANLGCPVYASLEEAISTGTRFDCAVMFEVIEHLPDPVGFLRQVREVVVPGGLLALSTPNFDSEAARQAPEQFLHFSPPVHISYFGLKTLPACVEQAGFSTVALEGSFAQGEPPFPGLMQAMLKPFRRGKRLRPRGALGKLLKRYLRRRALKLPQSPELLNRAETLELYARRLG